MRPTGVGRGNVTVRRVWAREKEALEPSLIYEVREGLAGLCGWKIEAQKPGHHLQPPTLLSTKHWTNSIPPRVSSSCIKWKLMWPTGLPNFSMLLWAKKENATCP